MNIGTLLVADTIHYNGKKESLEGLELEHVKRCLTDSSIDYRVGEFQTFDRPVLSKGEVLEGVLGVDMEAYASDLEMELSTCETSHGVYIFR